MTRELVRMSHPDVDGVIEVAVSAVPFHRAAGWAEVEEEAPPAAAEQDTPRRRRRAAEKEES